MKQKGFEGWYWKHQNGDDMIALIPGRAQSGAFVQVITTTGSYRFTVDSVSVEAGIIRAGDCLFSHNGCKISLPGIRGEIRYGPIQPLIGDIMGPFRFFPMECRHGVISMRHALEGKLWVDGVEHGFDGGLGYAEKDSGCSFPSSYLWMQCNDFPEESSVMVSVARIPFAGLHFRGCICAVVYGGYEYRFATYSGVRLLAVSPKRLCLSQGKYLLELEMQPLGEGFSLRAPREGEMTVSIRECCNARVQMRLWEDGRCLLETQSSRAVYEYVPGLHGL